MNMEKVQARADEIHKNTDFAVSWFAKNITKLYLELAT